MQRWKHFWEKWKNWERWPFALRYAPLGPLWLWYVIRAKHLWFFTPTNPTLTFAGFDGEGKMEMYDLLPEEYYPITICINPDVPFEEVRRKVAHHGFTYPFCVKPDRGLKGLLFRKVDSEEQLLYYHEHVPVEYLIQELVEEPVEVSVFYYRHPEQERGTISGLIQKELMHVIGDGKRTLLELIQQHSHAKHRMEEMCIKHERALTTVIQKGEKIMLAHAANLNRGARFTNMEEHIDDHLLSTFDALSHRCSFYYGRYDLKCHSLEQLKSGKFSILEFNGTGAEPNHVYHTGMSWFSALGVIARHWKVMYEVGAHNHRHRGIRYWGNREGYRFLWQAQKHAAILEKKDREILF